MNARQTALQVLNKMEQEHSYANLELKHALTKLEPKEAALATELVYGVLRYRLNLDYIWKHYSKLSEKKIALPIQNILRMGCYQIHYLDRVPDSAACNESVKLAHRFGNRGSAGFVNGVLRAVARGKEEVTYPASFIPGMAAKYSFPEALVALWRDQLGEERTAKLLVSLNENQAVCLRPNLLKTTMEAVKEELIHGGISFLDDEKVLHIRGFSAARFPGFAEGLMTIQDPGSMRIVELLDPKPGEQVLDLCAAPGGKSCYMAQRMENKGQITACDLHGHRLALIEKTAQRLGVTNLSLQQNDASIVNPAFAGRFDKVLVDAPCSGLGVIGSKPDIKWRQFDFDSLANLQYNILVAGMEALKPGGSLVYSTCTVNRLENEAVVERALEHRPKWRLAYQEQLFPSALSGGFFMCQISAK